MLKIFREYQLSRRNKNNNKNGNAYLPYLYVAVATAVLSKVLDKKDVQISCNTFKKIEQ